MFEKVNPSHPDKVADRIAGAIVDLSYAKQNNPKVAVEVLLGHGSCHIINETSVKLPLEAIKGIVRRIAGDDIKLDYLEVPQDPELAKNQEEEIRCGDNGIFRGVPDTEEVNQLTELARKIYKKYPSDGKYMSDRKNKRLVICQSNMNAEGKQELLDDLSFSYFDDYEIVVNPLGEWTGGSNVDCGATNRKIGSDMADGATGGGLHGKDLSKADVSLNIYAHVEAMKRGKTVEITCAIGDDYIIDDGKKVKYSECVEVARKFIEEKGGFEKFAEWGIE